MDGNGLTPKQTELLARLVEEMSEATKAAKEVLQHGYGAHHPESPFPSIGQDLAREIGHVLAAVQMLLATGSGLPSSVVFNSQRDKLALFQRRMRRQTTH